MGTERPTADTINVEDGFDEAESLSTIYLDDANQSWEDIVAQVAYIEEKCVFHNDPADEESKWTEIAVKNIKSFIQEPCSTFLFIYKNGNNEIIADINLLPVHKHQKCFDNSCPLYYFVKLPNSKSSTDFSHRILFGNVNMETSSILSFQRKLETCYQSNQTDLSINTSDADVSFFGHLNKTCCLLTRNPTLHVPAGWNDQRNWLLHSRHQLEVLAFQWLQQINESLLREETSSDNVDLSVPDEISIFQRRTEVLSKLLTQVEQAQQDNFQVSLKEHNSDLESEFELLYTRLQHSLEDAKTMSTIVKGMKEEWLNLQSTKAEDEATISVGQLVQYAKQTSKDNRFILEWLVHKIDVGVVQRCTTYISTTKLCQGYIISSIANINDSVAFATKCQQQIINCCQVISKDDGLIVIFLRRCQQLLKLCNYLRLFGRWKDGGKGDRWIVPARCCSLGEILIDSENIIDELLNKLLDVQHVLLDLRSPTWFQIKNMCDDRLKEIVTVFLNAVAENFESIEDDEKDGVVAFLGCFRDIEDINIAYLDKMSQPA